MESNFFIKSQRGNRYLVSLNKELIILASPLLVYFFQQKDNKITTNNLPPSICIEGTNYNETEIKYFFKKYKYLKQQGFFLSLENKYLFSGKIIAKNIEIQLANLIKFTQDIYFQRNLIDIMMLPE